MSSFTLEMEQQKQMNKSKGQIGEDANTTGKGGKGNQSTNSSSLKSDTGSGGQYGSSGLGYGGETLDSCRQYGADDIGPATGNQTGLKGRSLVDGQRNEDHLGGNDLGPAAGAGPAGNAQQPDFKQSRCC